VVVEGLVDFLSPLVAEKFRYGCSCG
jgi:hypothetical protein